MFQRCTVGNHRGQTLSDTFQLRTVCMLNFPNSLCKIRGHTASRMLVLQTKTKIKVDKNLFEFLAYAEG
jgi:hypothetical protein